MANNPMFFPAAIACIVVVAILAMGIASFAKGGEFSRKHSNKLMRYRLAAQAIAVLFIVLFVIIGRGGN